MIPRTHAPAAALALLVGLAVLLPACAAPCTLDLSRAANEGRVRTTRPKMPRTWGRHGVTDVAPYRPGTGTCTVIRYGRRLIVPVRDARGGLTELVVDTGSSLTLLSACSDLADQVVYSADTEVDTGRRRGAAGVLPRLELGGIVCPRVPVAVLDDRHSRAAPANLLGGIPLTGLVLCHTLATDRWWLRGGPGARAVPDGEGHTVSLLQRGLPVVRLYDGSGSVVHALIDTGAPFTHASVRSGLRGVPLTLADDTGRTLLTVTASRSIDWRMDVDGTPVDVYLGLDDLARLGFELDIDGGVLRVATEDSP